MRKILTLGLAALLLLAAVTVSAANWTNPQTTSPYALGIIPVKEKTNLFGQKTFEQDFGTANAGDSIAFVVRLEVPDKPHSALFVLKGAGCTINSVLAASAPMAPGVYYFSPDGTWRSDMTPITAYCTGVPTVTAKLEGTEKIESVGGYIVEADSGGYIFCNNDRGMIFCPDATGRVYVSYVFGPGYQHKMTGALMAENGEPAAVARGVLTALQMDAAQLLAGQVYMTDKSLAANFGIGIDTEYSKTWAQPVTEIPTATPVPIIPVAGVPETGVADDLFMIALILLLGGMMIYDRKRGGKI